MSPATTVRGGDAEVRKADRRKRLFGRPVVSLEGHELIRWLSHFANAHPNPASMIAREAHSWLFELERDGGQ